jgi:hypothetical protein
MNHASEIFETNYNNYCRQIAGVNFSLIKNTLGIEGDEDRLVIPFLNRDYRISKNGITDASGDRPDYITCVILAKYVLLCPDHIHQNAEWVSFKDFRKTSHFTNLNFFRSDVEQAIVKEFSGRLDTLSRSGKELVGGMDHPMGGSYDLSMQFNALPRISLLMLFNDKDDEFPAQCSILFQKQAEFYLDPESLLMTGAVLARNLKKICDR